MNRYQNKTYLEDLRTAAQAVPGVKELAGKSVLITGATGLIGSSLADLLLLSGARVYAAGRSRARLEARFAGAPGTVYFAEQDVNEPPAFDFSVDYIIHAASNAYPAVFQSDPVGTILNNVLGTHYLLDYAKTHGVKRFLFVSSGEVYGQGEPAPGGFSEGYSGYVDPTSPRSCYPASKRAAETLCVSYTKQFGLDTVIARPCLTYGPNANGSDNRANAQFVRQALAGEDIVMKSAGTQMRSYCYAADCASAILTVLLRGKTAAAYNVANPAAQVTIAGFAKAVAKAAGCKVLFENPSDADLAQQTAITYAVLNAEKLCALGWRGRFTVEEGVAHTIRILSAGR